jgi:hypothetical protein
MLPLRLAFLIAGRVLACLGRRRQRLALCEDLQETDDGIEAIDDCTPMAWGQHALPARGSSPVRARASIIALASLSSHHSRFPPSSR